MPEPSSPSRHDGPPSSRADGGRAGSADGRTRPSQASVPPSEPRPSSRASFSALDVQGPPRAPLQLIVALLLGLVLVAIPLYLWRRPRAESIATSTAAASATTRATLPVEEPEPPRVELSPAEVRECHDPGPKKTPPERCDHLVEVERALAKAIEGSADCVPSDAGGTIRFDADVSFKRGRVRVTTPRRGRSVKDKKAVKACRAAVRKSMKGLPLRDVRHEHARYVLSVTATYRGP